MKLLLISDALQQTGEGAFTLHPGLDEFGRRLASKRRQWFRCTNNNPLGWYAAIVGFPTAALLATHCADLPGDARQCWVASPYHGQPGRDSVRLIPESELAWDAEDARCLCGELNPLLNEEGMELHACGAALLLSCNEPIDADPVPFSAIAGGLLPNRHPVGKDGGRLMRLLAEIQMSLHANEQPAKRGKPAVNGLWLWGSCELPHAVPAGIAAVKSPDAWLQALNDQRADLAICESSQLADLQPDNEMPPNVLLTGSDHAVLLSHSLLPNLSRGWQPKSPLGEERLVARLRELVDAA